MSAESSIKASATISRTNIPPAAAPAEIFDPIYADLARLAAHVCQADFASIALNGTTAAWCSSTVRLAAAAAPQRDPFLEYALQSRELIEVADAAQDERLGADAFVIDGVGIRFYAGCALRIKDGSTVGVLAVYGTGPRQLTPAQRDALMLVVRQALVQAELRTRLLELALLSPSHSTGTFLSAADAIMAHALLESAPVAIYHTDATNKITYVNPEYRRLFGLTLEQSANDWAQAIHATDRLRIEETWSDFCRQPRPLKFEYRMEPVGGVVRYFCEQLVPATGVAGYVGTISDFTDLIAARGNLRRAETLLLNTFDQAPIGIAYADRDGRFLRCNPAFGALLNFGTEELAARSGSDLTHPDDVACSAAELEKLWNGEVDFVDVEKRYVRKDGSFIWVRATTALGRDASGNPDCSVEFLRDISHRKELAAALLQQQTLLEAVITDLPVALVACNTSGRITHHNRAAVELHCVDAPHARAQTYLADGLTPVSDQERPLARALQGETISNLELVIAPHGVDPRITLSSARRLIGPSGQILGAVAVVQDITERKQSELNLERVHKELMAASRQAGMAEVATNVLHNVGNILNSVNISASLVAERVKQSKAAGLSRVAALLRDQGARLAEFISNDVRGKRIPEYLATLGEQLTHDQQMTLQELASLRDNLEHIKDTVAMQQSYAKLCGVTETVEVADLVEDSLRLNAGAFARHGVTLQREFGEVPPITVDKHKVLQILVNLVRNAKYACDESGRTDKLVTLRIEPAVNAVRISVIDNGVGIAPENMSRLFSHGFTTRKSGHGFGLHSGALAAHDLGATLHAESAGLGRGAAFILELPCVPRDAARA
jgi:PAS domain S-box-containing protein